MLKPGSDISLDMPMESDAQFVAIAALFRHPDTVTDSWKYVLARDELDLDNARILEAVNNHLVLRPVKEN